MTHWVIAGTLPIVIFQAPQNLNFEKFRIVDGDLSVWVSFLALFGFKMPSPYSDQHLGGPFLTWLIKMRRNRSRFVAGTIDRKTNQGDYGKNAIALIACQK